MGEVDGETVNDLRDPECRISDDVQSQIDGLAKEYNNTNDEIRYALADHARAKADDPYHDLPPEVDVEPGAGA